MSKIFERFFLGGLTPDDQWGRKKTRGILYYIVVIWAFFKSQTWRLRRIGGLLTCRKDRLQVAIFVKIPDRV